MENRWKSGIEDSFCDIVKERYNFSTKAYWKLLLKAFITQKLSSVSLESF
jgi:hypothetical protein